MTEGTRVRRHSIAIGEKPYCAYRFSIKKWGRVFPKNLKEAYPVKGFFMWLILKRRYDL